MRFPFADELTLPCTFERFVPGKLHADLKSYLPLLIFRLHSSSEEIDAEAQQVTPTNMLLGVVDRHHLVDQALVGRDGTARLAFMMGRVQVQVPPYRQGLEPEAEVIADGISSQPRSWGYVTRVPAWETDREHLSYEYLYTELLLHIGIGTIGVRASATADDLTAHLGKASLEVGDWIEVGPSRIDILSFESSM